MTTFPVSLGIVTLTVLNTVACVEMDSTSDALASPTLAGNGPASKASVDAPDAGAMTARTKAATQTNRDAAVAVSLDNTDSFWAPSGAFTQVPYTTVLYDKSGHWDGATKQFRPAGPGAFEFCASLASTSRDGVFELDVFAGGIRQRAFAAAVRGVAEGCVTLDVTNTDGVDVRVYQSAVPSMGFSPNEHRNWLTVHKVSGIRTSLANVVAFTAPQRTFTAIPYSQAIEDSALEFDATNHRFVMSGAATVQACASVASFVPDFELDVFVNGTRTKAFAISKYGIAEGCRTFPVATGDVVDIRMYQSFVPSMSFAPNPYWSWLTMQRVPARLSINDTTSFTAANNAFTKIPFTGKVYDTSSEYDVSTNQLVAAVDEEYEICASLAGFAGEFELHMFVNDARENIVAMSNLGAANGCRTLKLAKGDKVDVRVWQQNTTGAALTFSPNVFWNWLTADAK